MTMPMTKRSASSFFYKTMIKQTKGEVWVGLLGANFAMRAVEIEEKPDGSVTFVRLVEYKDGRSRKEKISTRKEHIVYISETLEAN